MKVCTFQLALVCCFILVVLGLYPQSATADLPQSSYYVSVSGDDSTGTGTAENPWKTITFALAQLTPDSLNNDTLNVLPGRYSPSATGESFPLNLPSFLTLKGAGRDSTILDAEAVLDSLLRTVIDIIDAKVISVEGFTLTGGFASARPDNLGGGIFVQNASNVTIKYNDIVNNHAVSIFGGGGFGGGLFINLSESIIIFSNNIMSNDASGDGTGGGGIYAAASIMIVDNLISGNFVLGGFVPIGGGIALGSNDTYLISGNEITNNLSERIGAGLFFQDNSNTLVIRNNIFGNEILSSGGGIAIVGEEGNAVIGGTEGNGNNIYKNRAGVPIGKDLFVSEFDEIFHVNAEYNFFSTNFNPASSSDLVSPLDVFDTDPFSEDTIIFKDTRLVVFRPKLDFGTLKLGSTTERTFTIANLFRDDDSTLGITTALIDNDQFSVMEMPTSIENGKFSKAVISFTPNVEGETIAELTIESTSGTEIVRLRGGTDIIGIDEERGNSIPEDFVLYPPFPNPFNSRITITFELKKAMPISLSIQNVLGKRIKMLVEEYHNPGIYSYEWDGTNNYLELTGSGLYLIAFTAGEQTKTQKIVLLK